MVQLVAASMAAILALLANAIAQPYKRRSDYALAMCCDIVLVATFIWCFMLRVETIKQEMMGRFSEQVAEGISPCAAQLPWRGALFGTAYALCHCVAVLRLEPEHLAAGMVATLVSTFVVAGALCMLSVVHSAREAANEAEAVRRAEEARGRMAHPPTCSWTLQPGHTFTCFLSRAQWRTEL